MTISAPAVPDAATVLAELSSARTPWLALALAGRPAHSRLAAAASDITVIDVTNPQAIPVLVNPLEPAPGYPVQAHADRLAGLFVAAFGPGELVAEALRAGLRRAYADCGWDMRTGGARPGAPGSPVVPAFRQLKRATVDAALNLGYDPGMRAAVRGFLEARLDALWSGPAGLFLEGGHPADLARLLRGSVLVTGSDLVDEQAGSFLAGLLLLRLTEHLSHRVARPYAPREQEGGPDARGRPDAPRPVIVVAVPGRPAVADGSVVPGGPAEPGGPVFPAGPWPSPRGVAWLGRILEDLRIAGADITIAAVRDDGTGGSPSAGVPPGDAAAVAPLLAGRRSAACGDRCRRRPCTGYEVHAAGWLAADPGQAWLRLWGQALLLAFLTGRPMPGVPAPLRSAGRPAAAGQLRSGVPALSPRECECLLATVIDGAVAARAPALRPCYDPRSLTAVAATVAGRLLAGHDVPARAGSVWVIPQLRWLHEMERLSPLGRDRLRPDDIAPPLDFGLAGLPDWPGIRVTDRLGGLRGHPLAMESERNRAAAMTALLGDGRADLDADLAITGMGISPPLRLRHAARALAAAGYGGQPGWLEVVLSWPHRLIGPGPENPNDAPADPGRAPDRDRIASGRDEH